MTGWAPGEVRLRGRAMPRRSERLQYDFFYLRRQSLVFDLRIIGRTLRSVVRRQGR